MHGARIGARARINEKLAHRHALRGLPLQHRIDSRMKLLRLGSMSGQWHQLASTVLMILLFARCRLAFAYIAADGNHLRYWRRVASTFLYNIGESEHKEASQRSCAR